MNYINYLIKVSYMESNMEMIDEIQWEQYRHSEFLKTIKNSNLKYINLFLRKMESNSSER